MCFCVNSNSNQDGRKNNAYALQHYLNAHTECNDEDFTTSIMFSSTSGSRSVV